MTHAVRTKVSAAMRMSAFSPHQHVLAINSPGSQQFHCRSLAPHYAGGSRTHRGKVDVLPLQVNSILLCHLLSISWLRATVYILSDDCSAVDSPFTEERDQVAPAAALTNRRHHSS